MLHVVLDASAGVGHNKASIRSQLHATDILPGRPQGELGPGWLAVEGPNKVDEDSGETAVWRPEGAELYGGARKSELVLCEPCRFSGEDLVGPRSKAPQTPT